MKNRIAKYLEDMEGAGVGGSFLPDPALTPCSGSAKCLCGACRRATKQRFMKAARLYGTLTTEIVGNGGFSMETLWKACFKYIEEQERRADG